MAMKGPRAWKAAFRTCVVGVCICCMCIRVCIGKTGVCLHTRHELRFAK